MVDIGDITGISEKVSGIFQWIGEAVTFWQDWSFFSKVMSIFAIGIMIYLFRELMIAVHLIERNERKISQRHDPRRLRVGRSRQ